jgi:hypothetical protein
MPTNEARYLEQNDFRDGAATMRTPRKSSPVLSYSNFWNEYYSRPDRKIEDEIKPQLEEFSHYSKGWDSYEGLPLRIDTGNYALTILKSIMRAQTPMPQVVPTSSGGVQFEWHEKDIDLEMHITGPYECEVWFYDHRSLDIPETSVTLTNDVSILNEIIDLLTSR